MKQLDLAWLAGFTDGDGYFGYSSKSNGNAFAFVIGQNGDKKILQRCKEILLMGKINGPYYREGRKPNYRFVVNGKEKVLKVIDLLYPYLSDVKKKQANRLRKFSEQV